MDYPRRHDHRPRSRISRSRVPSSESTTWWISTSFLFVAVLASPSFSAETTWIGTDGGLWSTSTFWSAGTPTLYTNAVFNNANVSIVRDGNAMCNDLYLGSVVGGNGVLSVDSGGNLTGRGLFHVGFNGGNGTFSIVNGGHVSSSGVDIAESSGSTGSAIITGANSTLTSSSRIVVGDWGTGTFLIADGAKVTSSTSYGGAAGQIGGPAVEASGTVTVTGPGSTWDCQGYLELGYVGNGTLLIQNGGQVSDTLGFVGFNSPQAKVVVDGNGSKWIHSQDMRVGYGKSGTLAITNGGFVSGDYGEIGSNLNSSGSVTVDGSGSWLSNPEVLLVGYQGSAALTVTNGGKVTSGSVWLADQSTSTGNVTLDGSGSSLSADSLCVGRFGKGNLSVTGGANVSSADSQVAVSAGSTGNVTISGTGSLWTISSNLSIGGSNTSAGGAGTVTVANDGSLSVAGILRVWNTGALILGGGTLSAGGLAGNGTISVTSTSGSATLTFGSTANATYAGNIADSGGASLALFKTGTGTQILSGNNTYSGDTTVQAGTLLATNSSGSATGSGSVVVQSGATLGGTGSVGASGQSVTIQSNATLSPGSSPGVLSVLGDLAIDTGALLTFELNDPSKISLVNDRVDVSGTLSLVDGILMDVTIGGNYTPQAGDQWTLFTYSALSGNATDITLRNVTSAGSPLDLALSADSSRLVLTVVPEPSTLAMLAGGGLLGTWLWRRKKRKNKSR